MYILFFKMLYICVRYEKVCLYIDIAVRVCGHDLVNQFIWRGLDSGHASIQPYMGLNWKGLSVSAWGSVGITNSDDAKELDLNVFYTAGPLTVGITDYWFDTPNPNYFAYKAHDTSHVFEGAICRSLGKLFLLVTMG